MKLRPIIRMFAFFALACFGPAIVFTIGEHIAMAISTERARFFFRVSFYTFASGWPFYWLSAALGAIKGSDTP